MAITFLTNEDVDSTLTVEGQAADSSVVGERLSSLSSDLEYYKNYVTPQMYGAKGDGTTDDSDAIQLALDENEIVYIPPTVRGYSISKTLYMRKNGQMLIGGSFVYNKTNIFEPQSRIRSMASMADDSWCIEIPADVYGCTIQNIYLYGTRTSGTNMTNGIYLRGNADSPNGNNTINNVHIYQFSGCGIHAEQNCWDNTLRNVNVRRCNGNGIEWYSTDSLLDGVYVSACGLNGIVLGITAAQGANTLVGCKAYCNALHDSNSYGLSIIGGHNKIVAFNAQQNCSGGILVSGKYNVVDSCVVDGNGWISSWDDYVSRPDESVAIEINNIGNRMSGIILNDWLNGSVETAIKMGETAIGENVVDFTVDNNIRSYAVGEYLDRVDMTTLSIPYEVNSNKIVINGEERQKIEEKTIGLDGKYSLQGVTLTSVDNDEIVCTTDVSTGTRNVAIIDRTPEIVESKRIVIMHAKAKIDKPAYIVTRLQIHFNNGDTAINIDPENELSKVYSSKYQNITALFDISGVENIDSIMQLRFLFRGQGTGLVGDTLGVRDVSYYFSEKY